MNIYIYTNSYDANSGGAVVLHRLCHIINKHSEHNAYLVKLDPFNYGEKTIRKFLSKVKWEFINKYKFQTNPLWETPIWTNIKAFPEDAIVIYPEIINGNPLNIKNVVRWFLHQPGYHTGVIDYGDNELFYKFNSAIKDFHRSGSHISDNDLKVIYYPIDIYYQKDNIERDIESCFLVRKGFDKPPVHTSDAIRIDGLEHEQVADIFRRSKRFISYDDYTAYSIFSVLCGCASYVVPAEGQTITDWYPDKKDRYGISYGFSDEQQQWANETKDKVYERVLEEHEKSIHRVKTCLSEMNSYFFK
ncbi:WavQ [Citrobacter sedlakii]|uniref:WavQ n=1 Tax=Citrobacter sedlakii TaxID=67826 RepID=UPI0022B3B540|nr:WavQ [Citrobacter sedlakii]MCZ4673872.1 WavQ [Citrobacter sedlakii]MDR5003928.1 WavQ [Citrobacter sedlakii]